MNKEVKELAEKLFVKAYKPDEYLTDKNRKYVEGTVENAIAVAELFIKKLEEHEKK